MLGVQATFREDSEFLSRNAEAVFGTQLVLPGQFVINAELPLLSFIKDLQTTMAGRSPPPTQYNSAFSGHSSSKGLENVSKSHEKACRGCKAMKVLVKALKRAGQPREIWRAKRVLEEAVTMAR
jgi:hypothetical protein